MNDHTTTTMEIESRTHQEVQRYYGETLESSADLKTSACCTSAAPDGPVADILQLIHPEVQKRYYGCGLILPEALAGLRVLDLGCGAGRDAFLLSSLVGESGSVVGVDMTPAQLEVANTWRGYHADAFGFTESNVEFLQGNIERLDELDLAEASFDLVVSNCVINLAVDKAAVFNSVCRLLKPGGEMYFSDVYADRRIPAELAADPVLYGECLSGALYWKDFLRLADAAGLAPPRLVSDEPLRIDDPQVSDKIGPIRFSSATWRVFRLVAAESTAEDYGLQLSYRGSLPGHPGQFELDQDYCFATGHKTPVCGNTYRLVQQSRFAGHFDYFGDFSRHLGEFSGSMRKINFSGEASPSQSGACC